MAITLADFNKIWASTSPLTPYSFSDTNYKKGWNFIGSTPPSRQMWDCLQKKNDEKVQGLRDGSVILMDALVETIPANSDLDDYTTAGTYRAVSSTVTNTLVNCPFAGSALKLLVMQVGYGSSNYAMQLAFGTGRRIYVRSRVSNTSWGTWQQVAYMEQVLPLSGGTLTGTLIEEMPTPATRSAYRVTYTDIVNGTAPSTTRYGYMLIAYDGQETPDSLGGISFNVNYAGWSSTRMHNNWGGTSRYVEVSNDGSNLGSFRFSHDNYANLGSSAYRWKEIFAGTSTINTSDERVKDNIEAIPDAVIDAWGEVGWYQFQFKDAIAKKGENARIHTGTIAQRIKETFEKHNLDAFRYGLLCHDEWEAQEEEKDEDGKVTQEYRPAGDLYSLRYEEALCMEASYQRRRADRLEARLNALEERIARLEVK